MNRKLGADSGLRKGVERILNAPVPPEIWQYAINHYMVSEVQQGDNSIEWLAESIRELIGLAERPEITPQFVTPRRRQRRGRTLVGRREALSSALAEIARQREDVVHFRRIVLNGQLLKIEEVEQWLQEQRSREMYPRALVVRLKKGFTFERHSSWQLEPPLSAIGPEQIEGLVPPDYLEYARKGSNAAMYVPVGRDGTLRTTWELSKSLAGEFRWWEWQATMFLLTDSTPVVTEGIQLHPPPIVALPGGSFRLACLTRLTLTIDPMMTPREVARQYGDIRAKVLGRKPRTQNKKHLELAAFAVKHPALEKETMVEWGSQFPQWKYARLSLFRRDAQTAIARLLLQHPVDLSSQMYYRKPENSEIVAGGSSLPAGSEAENASSKDQQSGTG